MNILIVASKFPPEYTGPGVRIPRLYKAIGEELGVKRIDVICNGIEQVEKADYKFKDMQVQRRVAQYIRQDKFPFGLLPRRIHNVLAHIAENIITYKALQEHQPDLIHILGHSGGTAAALKYTAEQGIPVLMELVTAEAGPQQKYLFFTKARPHKNSLIIALTRNAQARCKAQGYSDEQIWYRPNPIDENIYKIEWGRRAELRKALSPFEPDDIVISAVAKMMPQKNQRLLVRAMPHLSEKFKLLLGGPLVGSGKLYERDKAYVEEIKSTIKQHGLESRVHMVLDFVNSAEYMKASDIYALPAWNEGFGTPMIEALACGLPVVANKGEPPFCEWIEGGVNGFLCDINNPEEWARAFEKAAELSEEQKRKASDHTHDRAGQKTIYKTYKDLIRKLVQNR